MDDMVDKDGADIGILGYTNASLPFLIFPINTPPPHHFWKNHVEIGVENLCKKSIEKKWGKSRVKSEEKKNHLEIFFFFLNLSFAL